MLNMFLREEDFDKFRRKEFGRSERIRVFFIDDHNYGSGMSSVMSLAEEVKKLYPQDGLNQIHCYTITEKESSRNINKTSIFIDMKVKEILDKHLEIL